GLQVGHSARRALTADFPPRARTLTAVGLCRRVRGASSGGRGMVALSLKYIQGNPTSAAPVYPDPMKENLSEFLFNAAREMRNLALRAPDIGNELRRFADDLENEAVNCGST